MSLLTILIAIVLAPLAIIIGYVLILGLIILAHLIWYAILGARFN